MIESLRMAFARRAVRRALAARRPRLLPALADRRVLVVFPEDGAGQRATWSLLATLGVPPPSIRPVFLAPFQADVPAAFQTGVRILVQDDWDWRRLPASAVQAALWSPAPDVAVNLADPDDLRAALLVGASPAGIRIGRHSADREACYDLMVEDVGGAAAAAVLLRRTLRRLDPPILPTL